MASKSRPPHKNYSAEMTKVLGEHVTQITSKICYFVDIRMLAYDVSQLFLDIPNLEDLSFPHNVHENDKLCWDPHDLPGFKEAMKYLRKYPIPYLPHLRKLSFACFPGIILDEILRRHCDQRELLEMMAKNSRELPEMSNLTELKLRVMKTGEASDFFLELINCPLKKLALVGTPDGNGIHSSSETFRLVECISSYQMFRDTLRVLELEFSGNVMWKTERFPKMDLPVLKTLTLKHCSNVTLRKYSWFLFSLKSIKTLSIDKAHCAHRKRGKCYQYGTTRPANCAEILCKFRYELRDSGLWERLPRLTLLSFRGSGMHAMHEMERSTYKKIISRGKATNFMEFFTEASGDEDTDLDEFESCKAV